MVPQSSVALLVLAPSIINCKTQRIILPQKYNSILHPASREKGHHEAILFHVRSIRKITDTFPNCIRGCSEVRFYLNCSIDVDILNSVA
jgi:hypothetical protein